MTFKATILALAVAFASAPAFATQDDETISAKTGDSLAGNYLAARVAATNRDAEAASTFFRKALEQDPDNEDLQFKAFLAYITNGQFEDAVKLGDMLRHKDDTSELVTIVMAVDKMRARSWAGVEEQLDRNWQSPLDRLIAGLIRAWAQQGAGDSDAALATVDDLDGPAWFNLFTQYHSGLIALAAKRPDEAVRRLEEAYANRAAAQASGETYLRALEAYITALMVAGDVDQAKRVVGRIRDVQPENPTVAALQADVLEGRTPKLISGARRGTAEVFLNLGTALNRDGGGNIARIYLEMARVLARDDVLIKISLAELLDRQGLLRKANELFKDVSKQSPNHRIAQLEIALNYDELGDTKEAEKRLSAMLLERPTDLVAAMSYGAVLSRHEKFAKAAKVYQASVDQLDDIDQRHWNLFYRMGIAYERTKQWEQAEAAFRKSLVLNPDHPSVLNYLGYSLVEMDIEVNEALNMIRRAVNQRPNDGYIVDSLGWAYYKLKRFPEAILELERAVELRPGDPTINDHLGDAYWRGNRRLEAKFQWRHALALDPEEDAIAAIEKKLNDGLPPLPKPGTKEPVAEQQPRSSGDNG
jgi:tetratricopeptide (TPR) repeat protein